MKLNKNMKNLTVELICLLYVSLFVYTAVSKLLDFENFRVQLGQSPILSAFASWITWSVPLIELLIAAMLLVSKYRISGLYFGLCLMTMFTVYIFIILHYSSFVPCSCGGILEKMSWNVHLFFNGVFILLAILAITLQNTLKTYRSYFASIIKMGTGMLLSTGVVIILFLSSENIIHNENPFIRRYPQHPVMRTYTKNLKFNSFYFAGYASGRVYLANYTDPLHVISMNNQLKDLQKLKITFDPKKIPFRLIRIFIQGNFFYLMDGTVPIVYRGSILDWKVTLEIKDSPYFNLAVPVDSTHIVFRSSNGENSSRIIGAFSPDSTPKILYNKTFLKKQIDGVFDTDGMLLSGESGEKIVYIYYYRNEFIVGDKSANLVRTGHTIDTNTTAKIKTAYLKNGDRTMSSVPLMVNQYSALCGNLLFVHSKIKGKYESDKLWEQASIIDVYDIEKQTYLMSFSIYGIRGKKLNSFYVTKTHLYALIGDQLAVHELKTILKKEFHFPEK